MKTLIIGANGMLGVELVKAFASHSPVLWTREDVDIADYALVREKILALAPGLVINAAGYTNVDACETNEDLATKINGDAVGNIASASKQLNATLVHYSTDYVFDGSKQEGYAEDDEPHPINAYGRSKLAGENGVRYQGKGTRHRFREQPQRDVKIAASASTPPPATTAGRRNDRFNYYIIRTSWLYGNGGKNFVETMLKLATAQSGEPLKVVEDQIGSPTYAPDLAQATFDLVKSGKPAGIYHRTNSGTTSWYGFAKAIFELYGKDVAVKPCKTEEFPRPAKRPASSILQTTKLPPLRSWQEALTDYYKTA